MFKNKKFLPAVTALFICLFGSAMVQIHDSQLMPRVAEASTTSTSTLFPKLDPRPRRLSIPSISLSREIIDVGVTKAGNLDVPPNYTQVGWYKMGTLPGNKGSAVLDGHVDNGASIAGPFKRLREVKVGESIFVTAADGTKLHFKVKEAHVYPTTQFPGELVFHDQSGKLLKINTCHGKFIKSLDTYDQRLIVTAELVN